MAQTQNIKTSPYYAHVGDSFMHSTGIAIEPRHRSGNTFWAIVYPDGTLLGNEWGKPQVYTSAEGAMRTLDALLSSC